MIKRGLLVIICALTVFILTEMALRMLIAIRLLPYVAKHAELLSSYQIMPMFDHPVSKIDSITGFRWIPGDHQTLKICRGQIVYSNNFKVNSLGFVSGLDYIKDKKENKKRYLVFGDSFTDGYYLSENWPTRCNRLFRKSETNIELYNYALNGNGLRAWYRLFQKLTEDSIAYDGIILAVFANDLERDLFVWQTDSHKSYFDWVNENQIDTLDYRSLSHWNNIKSSKWMQELTFSLNKGPQSLSKEGFLLPTYLWGSYHLLTSGSDFKNIMEKMNASYIWNEKFNPSEITESYFIKKYGIEKTRMLNSIIQSAKTQGKEVILAVIPDQNGLQLYSKKKQTIISAELRYFSKKHGTYFVDGYQCLSKEGSKQDYFLPMDGHWNQRGSDCFADSIIGLLLSMNQTHENAYSLRR